MKLLIVTLLIGSACGFHVAAPITQRAVALRPFTEAAPIRVSTNAISMAGKKTQSQKTSEGIVKSVGDISNFFVGDNNTAKFLIVAWVLFAVKALFFY